MSILKRFFKRRREPEKKTNGESIDISKTLADSAMNVIKEKTEIQTNPLKPGEVIVKLTSAESVGLGIGKFFDSLMNSDDSNTITLDILVLFSPRTGQTILSTDDPEGKGRSLKEIISDKKKSYILRIEKDNLDYLKQDLEIWKCIKKVVE